MSFSNKWKPISTNIPTIVGGGRFGKSCFFMGTANNVSKGSFIGDVFGDVTIEFQLYLQNAIRADWCGVWGQWDDTAAGSISLMIGATQTVCRISGTEIYPSGTPGTRWTDGLADGWHHYAIVRSGANWTLYVDGTEALVYSGDTNAMSIDGSKYNIKNDPSYNSGILWVDEIRISSMARYTSTFTAPSAAFDLGTDTYASTVLSLLHCEHTDTFDSTGRSVWYKNGGVTLDTLHHFGTNSLAFDGSSGYLNAGLGVDFDFTGAFTISCWVYVNASGPGSTILCTSYNSSNVMFAFGFVSSPSDTNWNSAGLYPAFGSYHYPDSSWDSLVASSTAISLSTWTHLEVDYDGAGNLYLFVDGTLSGSSSAWVQYGLQGSMIEMFIGRSYREPSFGSYYFLDGNIDELCVTKGVCRNTSNFTPPSAPFDLGTDPYASDIVCLLHMETLPLYDSNSPAPIEDEVDIYKGTSSFILMKPYLGFIQTPWNGPGLLQYMKPVTEIDLCHANYQFMTPNEDDRDYIHKQLDPNSNGGFVNGICVNQGIPLGGVTVQLFRNSDYALYSQQTTNTDGTFLFNDLQISGSPGWYSISANPNPTILDEDAQIYSQVTETPYSITTDGDFLETPSTTTISPISIKGNLEPFTVSLQSGSLPPGSTIEVDGRNISIVGASSFDPNGYVIDLKISGSLRGYTFTNEYEMTPSDVKGMGKQVTSIGDTLTISTISIPTIIGHRTSLLNFNGADGSTTITDSGQTPGTWTISSGSGSISTTESKFGGSSWYNNNSFVTSDISVPPASSSPWTIEMWFYSPTNTASWQQLWGVSSGYDGIYLNGTTLYMYASNSQLTQWDGITPGDWHFMVDQFDGSTRTVVVDGTVVMTYSGGNTESSSLAFGSDISSQSFPGYIDDFAYTAGIALYGPGTNQIPFSQVPSSQLTQTVYSS